MGQEDEGDHWWGKVSEQEDVEQLLKVCTEQIGKMSINDLFFSKVLFLQASDKGGAQASLKS